MTREGLILKIDCPDQPGLVARIAGYVADHRGNLVEFNQFTDTENERFFDSCRRPDHNRASAEGAL